MSVRLWLAAAAVLLVAGCGEADSRTASEMPSYSPHPTTKEPGATFIFAGEAGAHPVDERSGEWTAPASEIMVWERQGIVKVDAEDPSGFDYIRIELSGPDLAPLETGRYPDARNRDKAPDSPGMLVISGSLGCGDEYGEFVVDRIERDATGKLVAFDAGFTQRCGSNDKPALHGRIYFQA